MAENDQDFMAGIPNFEVPTDELAYPAGWYIAALGGIRPVWEDNANKDTDPIIAVVNDIWILKYINEDGMGLNPMTRITLKEGQVVMAQHGVRLAERYPTPASKPNLAWRARAFFAPFDAITEIDTGTLDPDGKKVVKKFVDWKKVKLAYGKVFKMSITYNKSKEGKSYRNIEYDNIELTGQVITLEDMKKIEQKYASMRNPEDQPTATAAPTADDLPF